MTHCEKCDYPLHTKEQHNHDLIRLIELDEEKDYEFSHCEADGIILKYLPDDIRDAYCRLGKWYA